MRPSLLWPPFPLWASTSAVWPPTHSLPGSCLDGISTLQHSSQLPLRLPEQTEVNVYTCMALCNTQVGVRLLLPEQTELIVWHFIQQCPGAVKALPARIQLH